MVKKYRTIDKYQTVAEAAERLGKHPSWLLHILAEAPERLPGAVKPGRDWLIPVDAEIRPKQYKLSEERRAYLARKKRESRERQKRKEA